MLLLLFQGAAAPDPEPEAVAAITSGAHGRKRGRELQEFLDAVAILAERQPEPEAEAPKPKPKRRVVRLPAREFAALPERHQEPVARAFRDMLADVNKRRALAEAMRKAIADAEDEDDVEAILFLM